MPAPRPADSVRVLHGFITRDGSLALWAETTPAPSPSGPATGGGGVAGHPFAVVATELPAGTAPPAAPLLPPSTGAGPMPSPLLGLKERRGRPRLRAWRVP